MDAHINCISCVDCIRNKNKILSFKYQPTLKSNYALNFLGNETKKQQPWNLDYEKRQLKVPFKLPCAN